MDTGTLLLFIALALLVEIAGTISGFGSSVLFVPLAGFFMDFYSVLGITAVFHVASNLSKIALFSSGIDWKITWWMGIPSVILVLAGAALSRVVNPFYLQYASSIFLLSMSLFMMVKSGWKLSPSKVSLVAGGAASGITAGMLGSGGAIRGLVLASFDLAPARFIATSALIDLGLDSGRTVVYAIHGYIHFANIYLVLPLLATSFAGTWIGKRLLARFSRRQFRWFVLALILATAVVTLLQLTFYPEPASVNSISPD